MSKWVADNGPTVALIVSVLSLLIAAGGFFRANRAMRLSQASVVVGEYHSLGVSGESGQLRYLVTIQNRGPGIALRVRITGNEVGAATVADRLAVDDPRTVEIESHEINAVRVQWRDGGGRQTAGLTVGPDPTWL